METEADGEDCGGPEPAKNSDPDKHPEADTDDKTGVSSETDVSDGDWEETIEPQSGLNSVINDEVPVSDLRCSTGEKPFSCSECGKRFATKSCLKRHMRCHTGEKPYSCSVCRKSFTQSGSLKKHTRTHTEEKRFSCSVCDKRFAWYKQLKRHKCVGHQSSQLHQTQTEENREAEPPASSSTKQMETEADRYLQPETEDKTGDSSEPVREDNDDDWEETKDPQSTLKNNMIDVSDERCNTRKKPFSCSECGKRFPSRTHLRVHTLIHTGEKPFSCAVCGRKFNQKTNLIRHMPRHTGEKAFSCSVCKKRFKYRGDVGRHMKLHTREKPSTSCVSDTKKTGTHSEPQSGLNSLLNNNVSPSDARHMTAPKGEKPFTCSVCGERFSLWANLMHHMTSHTGGRPSTSCVSDTAVTNTPDEETSEFSVAEIEGSCNDGTESREPQSGLNSQENNNVAASDERCKTGRKSYTCLECGRICRNKTNMKVHMRVHTGEKPFTCSICGKGFTQKANLIRHMPRHTRGKPYSCPVCKKRFRSEGYIERHMRVHKSDSTDTNTHSDIRKELERHLKPDTDDTTGKAFEPDISDERCNTYQNLFVCSVCGKRFGNKTNLKVHTLIHTGEKPFSCTVCGRRFNQKANLIRHMPRHTGEKAFSCSVCKKRFKYRGDVGRHMKVHIREKPSTSCISDTKKTSTRSDIHRGPERCLKPETDDKTGDSSETEVRDEKRYLDTTSYICSECGKRFSYKASLKVHMMSHTGEKPFNCSVCGKGFSQKVYLMRHMPLHTREKPYSCSVCKRRFRFEGAVLKHMRIHKREKPSSSLDQEDPEPPHVKEEQEELWTSQKGEQLQGLEEADIKFPFTPVPVKSEDDEEEPQSSQLHQRQTELMETEADGEDCGGPEPDRHLQPDTEDKSGDSSEPEREDSGDDWKEIREPQTGLNSLNNNKVPVSDERAEKPASCSFCGKSFTRKYSLKVHMRLHTGEKPFSCSVCGKGFVQRYHYLEHTRRHTGENTFDCSLCGKKFGHNFRLQSHMRTHTGERPISCSICSKGFRYNGELVQHMRVHSGEKPFPCSVCHKAFRLKCILNNHMKIHSGELPYSCSLCGKGFRQKSNLNQHMKMHKADNLKLQF
ncbi:zinc finger protein 585A-like isoform X3 [Sebastes umbrosus]|uniref:zinc finger protein 585A-like isoform X3 n=1 Tax=Sebastes umbrosus TaxID=72105 RepID=UPI00189FDD31|nr:zinc finger protein 585A-like isoform X3 [Sebastes umbrosus]